MSANDRLYSKEQIEEWASQRADDAGRLSRQLLCTMRENEKLREALQDFRNQAWDSLDPHTWFLNFQKADEALSNKDTSPHE